MKCFKFQTKKKIVMIYLQRLNRDVLHMTMPHNWLHHEPMFVRDSLDRMQQVNMLQPSQHVEQVLMGPTLTVTTMVHQLNVLVDHNLHDRLVFQNLHSLKRFFNESICRFTFSISIISLSLNKLEQEHPIYTC